MDKVAVVILNYNGKHFLEQFLPSVTRYSLGYRVIVADNGSSDDSVMFLEQNFPQIDIIRFDKNEGYSGGYNLALAQIEAEFYVLLNSDVEVSENWLPPMIELLDANPEIAACQPKLRAFHEREKFEYAGAAGGFIDKFGFPFCRGRLFSVLEDDKGQYDDIFEIFWASGAAMFVRASCFHEVGGLDTDFFAHMEEIDLCWRLKNKGYKIFYQGSSTIYHYGGGTLAKSHPRKTFLNFRNNLALLYKNLPKKDLVYIFCMRFFLDFIASLYFLAFGHWKPCLAVYKAYIDFFSNKKLWKNKRKKLIHKSDYAEIFRDSIVFHHFILGKKYFTQLKNK